MLNTALRFMSECDQAGLKYRDSRDLDDGNSLVVCGVSGKNNARYNVFFIFSSDQHSVSARAAGLVDFGEDKADAMLRLCNELNSTFRWLKFYVRDNKVSAQTDAIISEDTAGRVCVELLLRTMRIVDEAYPRFMHALWAE